SGADRDSAAGGRGRHRGCPRHEGGARLRREKGRKREEKPPVETPRRPPGGYFFLRKRLPEGHKVLAGLLPLRQPGFTCRGSSSAVAVQGCMNSGGLPVPLDPLAALLLPPSTAGTRSSDCCESWKGTAVMLPRRAGFAASMA